jgi:hypothetical protein
MTSKHLSADWKMWSIKIFGKKSPRVFFTCIGAKAIPSRFFGAATTQLARRLAPINQSWR